MTADTNALGSSVGVRSSAKCEAPQTNSPTDFEVKASLSRQPVTRINSLVMDQCKAAAKRYERKRDLPGLLHLFPSEIDRLDRQDAEAILKKIILALRAERRRGRAGHWRYSLTRHIGLKQASLAEKTRRRGS